MCTLRQDHLVRLWHACGLRPGDGSPGTALHLPLIAHPVMKVFAKLDVAGWRAGWPLRRLVAAGVAWPVLFAVLVGVGGGWAPSAAPGWTALVAAVALGGSATLASYLPQPGAGLSLELGCTPCATVAALSVLGAGAVLSTAPHDVSTAVLALVVVGFGLTQRLTNPSTCTTPSPSRIGVNSASGGPSTPARDQDRQPAREPES